MENKIVKIISENQNLIRKICNSFSQNPDERKDLFQEIAIQLWRSYPTFRNESKVTTWIYRIALNTAISSFRKNKKNKLHDSFETHEKSLQVKQNSIEKNEEIENLYKAINKLNDLEKSIILLYLDDYKSDEIAEVVGISSINVRVRINRIKTKLKDFLETLYS